MSEASRREMIAQLLVKHSVSNQQQLVNLLAVRGILTTRAAVARDLEDMGAVKVRVSVDKTVYAIPEHSADSVTPEDNLRRVMGDWVADIASSGNLVVLRTPPGSAHVVASVIDRAGMREVLGTVAGDDTLFVVVPEGISGVGLADKLRELAGLTRSSAHEVSQSVVGGQSAVNDDETDDGESASV